MADVSQIKLPNGSVYDLIDEKSGYITAEYIENKTDYEIPVSRVGEIVVGETAIGTDSTNFPTSKAVVDYVDERVVQEMDAIDVGVIGIKADGTSLSVVDGVVNIPVLSLNQSTGLMTNEYMANIYDYIDNVSYSIPTSTSQLTNDSGFITSETDPTVPAWAKASTKPTYTASEVGALPSDTVITDEKLKVTSLTSNGTYYPILSEDMINTSTKLGTNSFSYVQTSNKITLNLGYSGRHAGAITFRRSYGNGGITLSGNNASSANFFTITLPPADGTVALTSDIPTVPTNISSFTNDSGYLTASDIASVMTYKGTKANYAALPSTGNTTGDVWHLTDTGAEWAWDGSAWQELGTAIDLSGYATKATTLAGYGITDAKIQNGTITLGSNTITPLTSFTETDPVFSASAAAGITATDISNWNGKTNTNISYDSSSRTLKKTVNGTTSDVVDFGTAAFKLYTTTVTSDGTSLPTSAAVASFVEGKGYITGYTETDPVFSASAAAGITSTDISNWNGKSSTDEKLKISNISVTSAQTYYPIFGDNSASVATRQYDATGLRYQVSTNYSELMVGFYNPNKQGKITLFNSGYYKTLVPSTFTSSGTILLPDANGTIALTSDIPKVYSSTNTGGYLTMATLPIYDGTVV